MVLCNETFVKLKRDVVVLVRESDEIYPAVPRPATVLVVVEEMVDKNPSI